ncbi:MAG: glutaminyl-peptide cyclotransferase [Ferruginibacter sp.]|nr:glutaminyl-peptide cyclotransferase [Ferruginibacter sp.]
MRFSSAITGLVFLAACNNTTTDPDPSTGTIKPLTGIAAPKNININIIGIYSHDTSAYTQGLEIYKGKLYESTGDFINSSLRITDIKTGAVQQKHMMGSTEIFGEGITIFKDKIYQLTWKNHLVYVYDINNIAKPIKTFTWPYDGWGITHNQTDLIISDGSSNLFFVNPDDFKVKATKQVTDNIGPVNEINELEYFDGYVFANVYGNDYIIKIDPSNGHVVGTINLPGIIKEYGKGFVPDGNEVLNGIAWDSANKKLYITGKHWPRLFELTIN